jgi:hypothetical protein
MHRYVLYGLSAIRSGRSLPRRRGTSSQITVRSIASACATVSSSKNVSLGKRRSTHDKGMAMRTIAKTNGIARSSSSGAVLMWLAGPGALWLLA